MINAEGGTSCENHADVFQESLVFYLEVGEEKDNLTEEEQSKNTIMNKLKIWRRGEQHFKPFSHQLPTSLRPKTKGMKKKKIGLLS